MSFDWTKDLLDPLREIHLANRRSPSIALEEALRLLEFLLEGDLTDEDLHLVYDEIAFVHYRYGISSDAEPVVLAATERFPNSPLAWIAASKHYSFYCEPPRDLVTAKRLIRQAVDVARRSGSFVVHSLNELCRVAKAAEDYKMLEQGVEALLQHSHVKGTMDSACECDFLMNLPAGRVDESLIRRLHHRCTKRSC